MTQVETKPKAKAKDALPKAVRILAHCSLSAETVVIQFKKDQIIDDPHIIARVVQSDVKHEPC